ncbi:hypothetical protein IV500_13775 [Paeniglutamicibacter antarcticus]|uniref:DUF6286 domain-containing protein n=1 Tax=Arthrobacter terrae TaxID=2935737 RepID=A0A931CQT9_9MICC|nr:DUF6286 domain-containing protein [Arthrobacter terrae]MBG0740451.1 hypothetical protein [Arthrobacter terrae]
MSRHDGRSTSLRRRPSRTVPALIVGILLLAAGVALVWLTIARLMNGTWSMVLQGPRDWLTGLTWNSAGAWGVGVGAVVVGVILLLCAIVPGGFSALPVRSPDGSDQAPVQEQETVMTRRAVAQLARARCGQIDGVSSVTATATGKRVHLNVKTSLRESGDLRARVTDTISEHLETAGLDPVPRVSATIQSNA